MPGLDVQVSNALVVESPGQRRQTPATGSFVPATVERGTDGDMVGEAGVDERPTQLHSDGFALVTPMEAGHANGKGVHNGSPRRLELVVEHDGRGKDIHARLGHTNALVEECLHASMVT
jgi:hypothetical protein